MRLARTTGFTGAVLAAAALIFATGCGSSDSETGGGSSNHQGSSDSGNQFQQDIQASDDDFRALPVYLVVPGGGHPTGLSGFAFGSCGSVAVSYYTVPTEAETPEEAAEAGLNFLISSAQYNLGDPPLHNPLSLSYQTLEVDSVTLEGDTVNVSLSGDLITQSACEAEHVRAQLHATARSTTTAQEATITLNDQDLDAQLGLEPFSPGEPVTYE